MRAARSNSGRALADPIWKARLAGSCTPASSALAQNRSRFRLVGWICQSAANASLAAWNSKESRRPTESQNRKSPRLVPAAARIRSTASESSRTVQICTSVRRLRSVHIHVGFFRPSVDYSTGANTTTQPWRDSVRVFRPLTPRTPKASIHGRITREFMLRAGKWPALAGTQFDGDQRGPRSAEGAGCRG
jgi:hypothetical protein